MSHREKAVQLLHQQYHCSQAILGAYAEDLGLDLKTAFQISTCFGGGMRCGSTCGCITAGLLVLGMAFGFSDAQDRKKEALGNQKTEEFVARFTERMGGHRDCREILGKDISIPADMAEIRRLGLMQEKCPQAIAVCIDLLDEMLDGCQLSPVTASISLDNFREISDIHSIMQWAEKSRRFTADVNQLLHSTANNIAFIQFDVNRFKIINDLYGEKFGDKILEFINQRLKEFCTGGPYKGFYTNLRSDVFMIVTEFGEKEELTRLVEQLDEQINLYNTVPLQISYGIYIVQDKNMEQRQMEDRAAMARKEIKGDALTNIAFYEERFKDSLYNRKFIEENMSAAIGQRQIMMYLQPKYSITQNRIIGAEALVRWRHPERGMIFPDQFIPIVEENGFIQEIDYFIWEEACQFQRRCLDAGLTPCPISVNMSRLHLKDNLCIDMLKDMIERNGLEKSMIELEITETAGGMQIRKKALQLKDEGFTLLMDDFGSGYSSLNILLETPFDVIKLDKKFIENMMISDKGLLILEQVVSMAEKLDLELLAEGVETREQCEMLHRIGCDQVQGYYYAKPMPAEEFFERLAAEQTVRV
ncbi:MAG: EAL domain-containing protein [Oscillospiraceae bacterium]|nr:EAL domain-containing protein [Oscillospiraceae bacterium]